MTLLIWWFMAVLGCTWIITRSVIMKPLRRFFPKPRGTVPFMGTLVRCPQCMGFWVGAVFAVIHPVFAAGSMLELLRNVFVSACAASAAGHLMHVIMAKLGEKPPNDGDGDMVPEASAEGRPLALLSHRRLRSGGSRPRTRR